MRTRSDVFAFACRCHAAFAKATGRILIAEKLEQEAEKWDLDKATTAIDLTLPSPETVVDLEDITDLVTCIVALEDITNLYYRQRAAA
jgi:hypothetical protein